MVNTVFYVKKAHKNSTTNRNVLTSTVPEFVTISQSANLKKTVKPELNMPKRNDKKFQKRNIQLKISMNLSAIFS